MAERGGEGGEGGVIHGIALGRQALGGNVNLCEDHFWHRRELTEGPYGISVPPFRMGSNIFHGRVRPRHRYPQ